MTSMENLSTNGEGNGFGDRCLTVAAGMVYFVAERLLPNAGQPTMGRDTSHLGVSAYHNRIVEQGEAVDQSLPLAE